jgi:hypothetical protein
VVVEVDGQRHGVSCVGRGVSTSGSAPNDVGGICGPLQSGLRARGSPRIR